MAARRGSGLEAGSGSLGTLRVSSGGRRVAVALVALVAGLGFGAGGAGATVTRVEAESVTPVNGCWGVAGGAPFSGEAARGCGTAGVAFTFTTPADWSQPSVCVHGYADSSSRTARARVDGGAWSTLNPTINPAQYQVPLFCSGTLSASAHTFDVEYVSGSAFYIDFWEITSGTATTTTTTVATTTTTVAPTTTSSTTTTTVATTTTTTGPTTTTTSAPATTTTSPVVAALRAQTDVISLGLGLLVFCAFGALVATLGRGR